MIGTSAVSLTNKRWIIASDSALRDGDVERFAHEIRMPLLIARILMNRGVTDAGAAAAFLEPRFRDLHSPALLPGVDKAAARIATATKAGEKITLYGDYDVDGITGSAMLWHILKAAGAKVEIYIPHRVEEGYGLNTQAIDSLIDGGTQLLITVDCGCSAVGPISRARERGVDVVVSDHHEFGIELPPAAAIVHPRLDSFGGAAAGHNGESRFAPAYPNPHLCGAGVAFKLAWALAQKLSGGELVTPVYRDLLVEFSALVALGTIADVVPLVGENRILVKYGLAQLPRTRFEGLRALMEAAGYGENENGENGKQIDCYAVGFSLAPRLNAAGRMGHAREAMELLTTATGERARELAKWLEAQNRDRQATEKKMLEIARGQVEKAAGFENGRNARAPDGNPGPSRAIQAEPSDGDASGKHSGNSIHSTVLVVAHESFHAGVVGIVASRLVDLYHRPAFVLAAGEQECHGSARSISGFALHEAIEHVRDLLISGGGHAMAGGVRLAKIHLEAFTQRLNAFASERLSEEDLMPAIHADGLLDISDCHASLAALLEKLSPFGRGNSRPRFVLEGVRISAPPRRVGATGAHLQLTVSRPPQVLRCIAFKMGDLEPQLPVGTDLDLLVEPRLSTWQGRSRVELHIIDIARRRGAE